MTETGRKILTRPEIKKPKLDAKKKSIKKTVNHQAQEFNKERSLVSQAAPKTAHRTPRPSAKIVANLVEPETLIIKTDSLAFSLLGAAQAIAFVLEGLALPQALSRVAGQMEASPQARGAMQDIAYRTMRQVGRTDALINAMTSKPPEPPLLYGLMCCALTLLLSSEKDAPYDDFVVVDQAVNAAASSSQMVFAKGMVNAVLRRFLREKESLLTLVMKQAAARWNYPQWWIDQCKAAYPQEWQSILTAAETPPPLTLRVNQSQISVEDYLQRLHQEKMEASQIGPFAIRLHQPVPVQQIPGFAQGMVSVQDAAAQLAAVLLDLQDGQKVLDACAAPGGKTGHILELAKVDLLALDVDTKRLEKIHENLARLQLFATIKEGDASWSNWWDGQQFDRILADVPCTASGVVRRHPDIRWLRRKTDAAQLAAISAKILDNLWRMLKPGGKMLLATCSIWPIESEKQAQSFVERHNAIRLDVPGQLLPTSEINNEHDGLFYALFQKPRV